MKFYDGSNLNSEEISKNTTHLPLLPNSIDSKFWNQKYKKRVFTQIMKAEGLCKSIHYKNGTGPPWWGFENDLILWKDFAGPSQSPKGFAGNFSEFLFARIKSCYTFHNVDLNQHVLNPPLGKYEAMADKVENSSEQLENSNKHPDKVVESNEQLENTNKHIDEAIADKVVDSNEQHENIDEEIINEENINIQTVNSESAEIDLDEDDEEIPIINSNNNKNNSTKTKRQKKKKVTNVNIDSDSSEEDELNIPYEDDDDDLDLSDVIANDRVLLGITDDESEMDDSVLSEVELSGGALKKMHKGLEIRNIVLQIGEFNFMANNNLYQVLISDGKDSSHKVCLNSKFTKNLKKRLKVQKNRTWHDY